VYKRQAGGQDTSQLELVLSTIKSLL
jgi:hypothetical protein